MSVGQTIPVKEVELVDYVKVGRASSTFPCLPNNFSFNNQVLSRNHASIYLQNGMVYIKDTNSSNGTTVNGTSISALKSQNPQVELKCGDVIQFGSDVCLDNGTYHYAVSGKILFDLSLSELSNNCDCDSVDTIEGNSSFEKEATPAPENIVSTETTMVPSQKRNGYGRIKRILKHYESFEEIYSKKIIDLEKSVVDMKNSMELNYKFFYDQSLLISRIRSLEAQLAIYTSEYQGDPIINDLVTYEKKIMDIECQWKEDLLKLHYNSEDMISTNKTSSIAEKTENKQKETIEPSSSCLHDEESYTETESYRLMLEMHYRIKSIIKSNFENGVDSIDVIDPENLNLSAHIKLIIEEIDQETRRFTILRKLVGLIPDENLDSGLHDVPTGKTWNTNSNLKTLSVAIFSIGLLSSIIYYFSRI